MQGFGFLVAAGAALVVNTVLISEAWTDGVQQPAGQTPGIAHSQAAVTRVLAQAPLPVQQQCHSAVTAPCLAFPPVVSRVL